MQGLIDCPRCEYEDCNEDYNVATEESIQVCNQCGYFYNKHIVRNEAGGTIFQEDGKTPRYCEHTINGYAAVHILYDGGIAEGGPVTDKGEFDKFKENYQDLLDMSKVRKILFSRVEDGEIIQGVIYEEK